MAPPAAEAIRQPRLKPIPTAPRDSQAEALHAVAAAMASIADEMKATREAFQPAADTIHGFGARLDALCGWFRGKWPWIGLSAALLLYQTISRAPEEMPKLLTALAEFVKAFVG